MRRTTVTTAVTSGVVLGLVALGAAAPAQAATPAKKRVTVVHEKTTKEVLSGKAKLKIGDKGKAVKDVQKRLTQAGIITPVTGKYTYTTSLAVERFQGKFFWDSSGVVTKGTYVKLRSLTRHGDGVPHACKTASKIVCVDKSLKIVRYYRHGTLVKSLDARFGGPGNRTREGNFRIHAKTAHNISSLYGTQMDWSLYFSGGQAVHFSRYFRADGYNGASHGCVNLRDWKGAKYIFNHMPVGGKVKVYR